MLGYWCFDFVKSEEDRSYLWKDEDLDACGNHGGMQLLRSSYVLGRFEWRAYCDIAKIEKSQMSTSCTLIVWRTMNHPGPKILNFN